VKQGRKPITLVIIAVLLVFALLAFLLFFQDTETPEVRLAEIPVTEDDAGAPDNPASFIEITPDNVQNVIATLERASAYSRTINQTRYWSSGTGSATSEADIWVTPDALRIIWADGENMILTETAYHIWFDDRPHQSRPITAGLGTSLEQILDEFQGIPSYETVLELDPSQIIEAGYVLKNIGGIYEYCIYLVFEGGSLGYTDRYYISLSSGLLIAMLTLDGDVPVFRMETLRLTLETPPADMFTLPDGTSVLHDS